MSTEHFREVQHHIRMHVDEISFLLMVSVTQAFAYKSRFRRNCDAIPVQTGVIGADSQARSKPFPYISVHSGCEAFAQGHVLVMLPTRAVYTGAYSYKPVVPKSISHYTMGKFYAFVGIVLGRYGRPQ